jgi:hypothetical protein
MVLGGLHYYNIPPLISDMHHNNGFRVADTRLLTCLGLVVSGGYGGEGVEAKNDQIGVGMVYKSE